MQITLDELLALKEALWPSITFYDKQVAIIKSTLEKRETHVPAGNKLGKDFVTAFIVLGAFIVCAAKGITCRMVTTSVADEHLDILWGEIGNLVRTSRLPLDMAHGGDFAVNDKEIRRKDEAQERNALNYLKGQVYKKGEKLAGAHAEFTLFVGDESSGLDDDAYKAAQGWAKHMLFIGNPNPCQNFWNRAIKAGASKWVDVIRIRGEDSPNVKAKAQVISGVLTLDEYEWRRANWDAQRQQIGLDAIFPEDEGVLLFPPEWLNNSRRKAMELLGSRKRMARGMGVDPAEGGDKTAWCVVDEHGVLELVSKKTPNTTVIVRDTVDLMRRWGLSGEQVCFDRACGKAHADILREMGFAVRTVHFGESVLLDLKRGLTRIEDRRENREEKSVYKNRRVEMYHCLSQLCNPSNERGGFGIPERFEALFFQLAPMPHKYDKESGDGKLILPDKQEMIATLYGGRGSPDEADALVLAVHAMTHKASRARAGAA